MEVNQQLAELLAARDSPSWTSCIDDATELSRLLGERGLRQADVVISGLPWAAFPDELQRGLLARCPRR